MTIAELLEHEVVDVDGRRLGRVHDVRARTTPGGPVVHELVVGTGGFAYRLGYPNGRVRGPWLLRRVTAALRRDLHLVPWEHVDVRDGLIHLDVTVDRLERLEEDR